MGEIQGHRDRTRSTLEALRVMVQDDRLTRAVDSFDEYVDELLALLEEQYPDPVDVLEDRLTHDIGLRRHPSTSQQEWRGLRAAAINAAEEAEACIRHSVSSACAGKVNPGSISNRASLPPFGDAGR